MPSTSTHPQPSIAAHIDLRYLEAAAALLSGPKDHANSLCAVSGASVLDVGCGTGQDVLALAAAVGCTGRVTGVDLDSSMIGVASAAATSADLNAPVEFRAADAYDLPFSPATFDIVRAERVVQHLERPAAALAEFARVLRPGGRIVLVDTDWTSLSIAGDIDLERRIVSELRNLVAQPTAGRDLPALLAGVGCTAIDVRTFPLQFTDLQLGRLLAQMDRVEQSALDSCRLTLEERDRWRARCEELDARGAFYGAAVAVVASAVL